MSAKIVFTGSHAHDILSHGSILYKIMLSSSKKSFPHSFTKGRVTARKWTVFYLPALHTREPNPNNQLCPPTQCTHAALSHLRNTHQVQHWTTCPSNPAELISVFDCTQQKLICSCLSNLCFVGWLLGQLTEAEGSYSLPPLGNGTRHWKSARNLAVLPF